MAVACWWEMTQVVNPEWLAIGHGDYIETAAMLAIDESLPNMDIARMPVNKHLSDTIALDTPQALINGHFKESAIEFAAVGEPPRERLSALPGVTQALFENGHPTLYTEDVPRTMADLFGLVSTGELAFKDMVVRQATLEDVFLKLTGRRIRS